MGILSHRFPSFREILDVFMVCVFTIFMWSIINILREMPAWILRLKTWDLIGVIAYTQAFALVESLIVLLIMIFIGSVLPARLFRARFVALGSLVVLLTSAWVGIAHFADDAVRLWGKREFLLAFMGYLISIGIPYIFILRSERIERLLRSVVNRLYILSLAYVLGGVLGLIVVIIRNF